MKQLALDMFQNKLNILNLMKKDLSIHLFQFLQIHYWILEILSNPVDLKIPHKTTRTGLLSAKIKS